jgi:hypothetical protein
VRVARAQVRSGPGENFYPTDALEEGETVEVYREQVGGWLAIRPPQDSFSWVFGRHLNVRADGLAEVAKDQVASRIGSRFGGQRNAVQVQLRKGEVVEILGEEESSGEAWYKIAPPAGEFRWIQAAQVQRSGPLGGGEGEAAADDEPAVIAASATNDNPQPASNAAAPAAEPATPAAESSSAPAAEAGPGESWRAAGVGGKPAAAELTAPPLAAPTPSRETAAQRTADPPTAVVAPLASARAPAASADQPPAELARQLTDIELRLSRMVAAPPDQWNTERLERDTEELLAQAQTAEQRESLKAMLAKLDRFEALGRKYQGQGAGGMNVGGIAESTGVKLATDASMHGAAAVDSALRPTPSGAAQVAGQYDAVGVLRPVVSKRPGAPQFALVDEAGRVTSFVTPTPDVNLQPYVGHRVGVTGARGFISEFQRAHVTAGRVTPLADRVLR